LYPVGYKNLVVIFIYIGNVSSPVITRLGVNQFWYRHWYNDFGVNFLRSLHAGNLVESLLKIYLDYGLFFRSNPLVHTYWFSKN
jgi:hypothetical protein